MESGKGEKDRDLAVPDYLTDLLDTWRNIRSKGSFFFSTLKGGNFQIDTFSRWSKDMLKNPELKKEYHLIP